MTSLASPGLFSVLITLAIVGAATAAVVLLVMVVLDWRRRSIW